MNRKRFRSLIVVPLAAVSLMVTSVSPALALASTPITAMQKSEVVVVYKNSAGRDKVLNQAIEVKDEFTSLKAINLVLPDSAIHFLKNDPDISYIEHQVDQQVELLGTPGQWNVEAVNAPKAWAQGITGQGVKVAIIDSGVSYHNEMPNLVKRISFVEDDPATLKDESTPFDNNGHGTHVAGIVGAKIGGPTSMEGREFVGVAPNASLYSLKVMDGDQGSILDVIEAIDWAIANDMDIINLSLGLSSHVQLLQDAADRAYSAGILLVGAAGNDNVGSPVNYPAKYQSVIAVSSVDSRKSLSSFSSTGAEIEFTAPGSGIASTYVNGSISTYGVMSGTSQAAPHIAGFLALLKQKNPTKTASELRVELQKYAEDLGPDGRDEFYGYGFIDYNTLDDIPPGDVMNLQAAATTTDSITVSFTKPADADFVKTNLYLDGALSGETASDSYTLTDLSPDTVYSISTKTVDGHGNLSNGVSILVKTKALPDTTAPSEVTEIRAESITETSAIISWTNPVEDDFSQVNIYFNDEKIKTVLKEENPSYTNTGLAPDTAYSVLIRTVDQTGNESTGKTVAFTTEAVPVEVPVESPAPSEPGGQDPSEPRGEEQPGPSEPGTQDQPISPVPTAPAPSPVETAPISGDHDELLVTKEKLVETNGKIELTLPSNTGKVIFSPDVWNEIKIMKKDLYMSFSGLSILMPKENIANVRLEHLTEISVSKEISAPPKGANLLTDLVKIEMVDQVTKRRLNTFVKPITITLDLSTVPSGVLEKAIFAARKTGGEWQFAGGNVVDEKLVLNTKQLASFAVMENHRTFVDIINHWAKPEIEQLASRLIIQGKTADLFSPNEEVTRAQFVVLLARMLSIPTKEYSGTFKDVPKSQKWAAGYIEAAQRHGITSGIGDGTFQPNRVITRQEMAAMIVRALRVENPDALQENSATTKPFTDDKQLSTTFKQEIYQATKAGLIKGLPDGSFNPLAKATRAQTSVVLYRALQ